MTTFLLVHGAWQGPECWSAVISHLMSRGARVTAPVLTGLGHDRKNLSDRLDLSTHVRDVVAAIDREDGQVVLVGHSYGGMVITGACEQRAAKVAGLVYVDAFVPSDGQSGYQIFPDAVAKQFDGIAAEHGDGWRLPAMSALLDLWGTRSPEHRKSVEAGFSDFSIRCFKESLALPENHASRKPRGFIACGAAHDFPARDVFKGGADAARSGGWLLAHLDSGHTCAVEQPVAVADALTSFAAKL